MSITRFGYQNSVLTGILAAGSQQLPVGNLQGQLGSSAVAWQTAPGVVTSAAGAWIKGNTQTYAINFDCFAVFRTNLTGSANIRARGFSDAFTTTVYDSGMIPARVVPGVFQSIILPATSTSGYYWQIDFDDPSNPDGFINIPLMYVGPLLAPQIGMQQGSVYSNVGGNAQTTLRYGQVYFNAYWAARQWTVAMGGIYDYEMPAFTTMDLLSRDGTNILFVPDCTSFYVNRDSVYGLCQSNGFGYALAHKDARSWTAQIVERL